jgi:hypothetical protein
MGGVFFFASHDPGGYNTIEPIIERLLSDGLNKVVLCMLGPAKVRAERFRKNRNVVMLNTKGFPIDGFPNEYNILQSEVSKMISDSLPDLIITATSINSDIERYSIDNGKRNGIPVITIIDSWVGVDVRFTSSTIKAYPDIIVVNDIYMASLYDTFKSNGCDIRVISNLNFEKLFKERNVLMDRGSINNNRVLFFSENLYHYKYAEDINELIIVKNIIHNCQINCKIRLIIRPHPLESIDHWISFIEENSGVNDNISIELDTISNLKESIHNSSIVIGISTMALIESSILNKPAFSYQIGFDHRPDLLYIPFESFEITRIKTMEQLKEIFSFNSINTNMPNLSFLGKDSYSLYMALFTGVKKK